ncbi:viral movement protein [Medicago truncatula]|uniref:Viral movement protein n=1 Tax=Medicago truncatula TaxID=3880 RepID=G7IJI0_MEDTR|nr:viral movement protein [Medicago truncatula]
MGDIEHLNITEEDGNYEGSILIDPTLFQKIQKEDLDLTNDANMKGKEKIGGIMKRFNQKENIIYYGKLINESPTDIADAQGHTYIKLLDKKKLMELKRNIKKEEHRNRIGYIHIGAIQVLIKSTFQEGINSPLELILKDDRITDSVDKILGVVEGNLAYVKLKFEIHPNIGIPLDTQRLDQALTLEHKLLRGNLMKPGDKIFSITYCVNYALTNSHHRITFRNNNRIDVPSLFEDIGKIYYPKRNEITELGTFINRSKILELKGTRIPRPIRFHEPEKVEESNIDKLSNQVKELTTYLKNRL